MAEEPRLVSRSDVAEKRRIAVIAGNGRLPVEVATRLEANGYPVYIVGIAGEADTLIADFQSDMIEWGQIGRLFKLLGAANVQDVVLAGGIVGRPEIRLAKMDWGALRTVPGLLSALLGGDNSILSGVIGVFEKRGFQVRNLAELLPEIIVGEGTITPRKPGRENLRQLQEGAAVTRSLGPYDVGQACVVVGRRAVALEGVEGTDAMLSRIVHLRQIGRLPAKKGGVLVKCVKPGQDERADLPTIGPGTIEQVFEAKLEGIGVEAGKTVIVDRDTTLAMARERGVFVYGIERPQDPKRAGK